jgi:(1->4)-alpha-D-glucan 1-alpha-D-glucosylmutase
MSRPLRATYRIQFNAGFTFAEAEALVPYLAALGVSHLYASPIFAARAGSTHGYDVVDPNRLNPELGTEAEFASLLAALHRAEMGLLLDIVPNHMAVGRANEMLQRALCLGPDSFAARVFDIDWSGDRVAMPFLGGPLDEVLDHIVLARDAATGLLLAVYHENAFALRPESTADLLAAAGLDAGLEAKWRDLEATPDEAAFADAALATSRLDGEAAEALDAALAEADRRAVLAAQRWRLDDWRSARDTLSHRRFFNITELIGVRVEDPEVFEWSHRLALELVRSGDVDGLRIDHIDGLRDPEGYCHRLRAAVGPDVPILVEKILGLHETLPDWPIEGTTGYERLNEINRLFVDAAAAAAFDGHLVATGELESDHASRLVRAKRQVLDELFAPELDRLARAGADLLGGDPEATRAAIRALLVHFPVYRSYATERGWSEGDAAAWDEALVRLRRHETDALAEHAARLYRILRAGGGDIPGFLAAFQQLSGPAMAKGLEDTELYRSVGLASVNEVGGEPDAPAASPGDLHRSVEARRVRGDRSLVPLATHDTKRGPDTRARINALSLDPRAWLEEAARWRHLAADLREDPRVPDGLDTWLIFQTAAGAWPLEPERLADYMEKAIREAKRHTRWEDPDPAYEEPTLALARAVAGADPNGPLGDAIARFVDRIEGAARVNGLAQTILQLTLPGIPDIYQGTELWDRSLVDPDNRRPVDFRLRRRLLEERHLPPLGEDAEGAVKMTVTAALLGLRRDDPALFLDGDYEPLAAGRSDLVGFLRRGPGGRQLLVAVPLRGRPVTAPVPGSGWTDLLTGAPAAGGGDVPMPEDRPFLLMVRES